MEANKLTQLSDEKPRFDKPIRIALSMNAPDREENVCNDDSLRQHIFSPSAFSKSLAELTDSSTISNHSRPFLQADLISIQNAEASTAISDYQAVAYSNRRLGKRNIEGSSYISLGVIYDNQKNYPKAIEEYEKYLEIAQSQEFEDTIGLLSACNCIAVDYVLLASPPSECGTIDGAIHDKGKAMDYITQAIKYSQRHLDMSIDDGGRFVAHTNLGLCYGMQGDLILAGKHQQEALRVSIKMQTIYGQSIAVGNLGLIALKKHDLNTAKTCFQQHLQLVQALNDKEAEIKAQDMVSIALALAIYFSLTLL
jgi:tetratricopeptide (TPR) repeat protein